MAQIGLYDISIPNFYRTNEKMFAGNALGPNYNLITVKPVN